MFQYRRIEADILTNENGSSGFFKVSGNSSAATAPAMQAKISSNTNVARQPNAVCNNPPMVGATIGANAVIDPIIDNSRLARGPE